jgi:hypothetical protein
MVIFHSYVSLPEGKFHNLRGTICNFHPQPLLLALNIGTFGRVGDPVAGRRPSRGRPGMVIFRRFASSDGLVFLGKSTGNPWFLHFFTI